MTDNKNIDKNRVTFYLSDENQTKLNRLKGFWRYDRPNDKKYLNKLYNDIIEQYYQMKSPTEEFMKKHKK